MNIRETFGVNLQSCRRSLGLSQEKLAELCGCSRQYISKVEQAQSNIGLETAMHICSHLNIDLIQLIARFNEDGHLVTGQLRTTSPVGNGYLSKASRSNASTNPSNSMGPADLISSNCGMSIVYQGGSGILYSVDVAPSDYDLTLQTIENLRKKGYHGEYLNFRLVKMLPELNAVYKKYL